MLPNEQATDSMGFTEKTVAEVLTGKHPTEKKIHFLSYKCMRKHLFLFPWKLQRM